MKTYTTSQVVRLLELHPDWEFIAPETRDLFACTADCDVMHICFATEIEGTIFRNAPIRSDWTRVKPAKSKLERVKVGAVIQSEQGGSMLHDRDALSKLSNGTWTLYAVKDT